MSELPLPYGWIQETDPTHNHPYYVDTKANPPRSIWVHPYEDEQYLSEHPDVREKVGKRHSASGVDLKPSADDSDQRRHSYGGEGSQRVEETPASSSNPGLNNQGKKRGVFGRLKDKAIGTKEEREAERKRAAEIDRIRQQQYQERLAALQQQRQQQQQFAGPAYGGAPMYGAPAGAPYQQAGYGGGGGFGGRRGGGMGGLGVPLLGGLAGGLLLGDLIGGGFGGDGGDFGGGDFGGDGGFF